MEIFMMRLTNSFQIPQGPVSKLPARQANLDAAEGAFQNKMESISGLSARPPSSSGLGRNAGAVGRSTNHHSKNEAGNFGRVNPSAAAPTGQRKVFTVPVATDANLGAAPENTNSLPQESSLHHLMGINNLTQVGDRLLPTPSSEVAFSDGSRMNILNLTAYLKSHGLNPNLFGEIVE
jgi:hypothetical protein